MNGEICSVCEDVVLSAKLHPIDVSWPLMAEGLGLSKASSVKEFPLECDKGNLSISNRWSGLGITR